MKIMELSIVLLALLPTANLRSMKGTQWGTISFVEEKDEIVCRMHGWTSDGTSEFITISKLKESDELWAFSGTKATTLADPTKKQEIMSLGQAKAAKYYRKCEQLHSEQKK